MTDNLNQLLDRCLGNQSSGIEIRVASMGCLLGSALIFLAIQFWSEAKGLHSHPVEEAYYLTLNKTVKGVFWKIFLKTVTDLMRMRLRQSKNYLELLRWEAPEITSLLP